MAVTFSTGKRSLSYSHQCGINAVKCTIAILYDLAAASSAAASKRAQASQVSIQQTEAGRISYPEHAVQFHGESLANYPDVEVKKKHEHYVAVLRQAYTNPKLSQDALERGNYKKALEEYNEAVKRNPDNTRLYLTRAWCHRKLKSCSKAIEDYKAAIGLDPKNAAAYTKMGAAYQHMGQRIEAEKSYKKALELDPTESEAERALKDLHSASSKQSVQRSALRK